MYLQPQVVDLLSEGARPEVRLVVLGRLEVYDHVQVAVVTGS